MWMEEQVVLWKTSKCMHEMQISERKNKQNAIADL